MLLIILVCWFYGNTQYVSISYFPFFHTLKANAENGAMQFVKGTHKNGFYGQVRSQKSGNVLSDNLEIDIKPEWKDKIIQTQLVSGQCSFHDGTVLKIALFRCTYMLCICKFFFLGRYVSAWIKSNSYEKENWIDGSIYPAGCEFDPITYKLQWLLRRLQEANTNI